MLWIIFALIATFAWACANILDKVLRTNYLKKSLPLTAAFGIYGIVFSFILLLFVGIPIVPFWHFLAALISGFFLTYGIIPYIKALSLEEASRVVPLWHFIPMFTLILAMIFLDEVLTPLKYAAFASILLGGFLISIKRVGRIFRISPAVIFMVISSFLLSVSEVLLKFAHSSGKFWQIFLIFYFGATLSSLSFFVLPSVRKEVIKTFFSYKYAFVFILLFTVTLGFIGQMSFNRALLTGQVTLVSVFVSFQSLFVLLIATFLSLKFPLFIKEGIDIKTIGTKLVSIALMAFGLYLLVL